MTRTKVIVVIVGLATSFAVGRYSATRISSSETTTEIKKDTEKQTNTDTHKVTVIEKKPDGTEKTVVTEDTKTESKKVGSTTTNSDTVIVNKHSIINISALASLDMDDGFTPVYGVSFNKEFIGPVTVGAFAMTNGILGISLGLNF